MRTLIVLSLAAALAACGSIEPKNTEGTSPTPAETPSPCADGRELTENQVCP